MAEEEDQRGTLPLAELSHKKEDPGDGVDERALIVAAQRGDAHSLNRLLVLHQDRVFRTALHLLGGNYDEACDLAQGVLLKIARNITTFRGESRFTTWIHRITANEAKNHLAGRRRHDRRVIAIEEMSRRDGEDPAEAVLPHEGPNPRHQAAGEEMMRHLQHALGELSEDFRAPLVLHEIEGLPYEEIASALDVPIGTVKSRISRARRELRRLMADHLASGGGAP